MRLILAFCVLILFTTTAFPIAPGAWGGGGVDFGGDFGSGGGDDCGGCVPPSLQQSAESLRQDFEQSEIQSLLDQQLFGTLCENNFCGGLSENQADNLLDRALANARDRVNEEGRFEEVWRERLGALFAFLGLVIAWLAYRQSRKNESEIGFLKGTLQAPPKGENS